MIIFELFKPFYMATIKFYPYNKSGASKIYVRILIGRLKDIRQSTGLDIADVKNWSIDTNLPKQTSAIDKKLRNRLNELHEVLSDLIDHYTLDADKSLKSLNGRIIKEAINQFNNLESTDDKDILHVFADYYAKSLSKRTFTRKGHKYNYKPLTIYKYQNFANILKEFSELKGTQFLIADVDNNFADDFLNYLVEVKGHSVNTQGKFIRRLKTVVKNAQSQGLKVNPDYTLIKSFEDERIVTYLTFDELDQLQKHDLDNNERLIIARDWFIISCFTAQRISDVQNFNTSQIKIYDGVEYLCFKQYKTPKSVEVPIHYKVKAILKKYKGFPPRFTDNQDSQRSMLSQLIKKACQKAKINESVDGKYLGKRDFYPKYKLISNHTGRRSFACNFYGLDGWTLPTIMAITGHESEKSFLYYIDKEDNTLSRRAGAMFEEMEKKELNKLKEVKESQEVTMRIVKKSV
jgi:integrase